MQIRTHTPLDLKKRDWDYLQLDITKKYDLSTWEMDGSLTLRALTKCGLCYHSIHRFPHEIMWSFVDLLLLPQIGRFLWIKLSYDVPGYLWSSTALLTLQISSNREESSFTYVWIIAPTENPFPERAIVRLFLISVIFVTHIATLQYSTTVVAQSALMTSHAGIIYKIHENCK